MLDVYLFHMVTSSVCLSVLYGCLIRMLACSTWLPVVITYEPNMSSPAVTIRVTVGYQS